MPTDYVIDAEQRTVFTLGLGTLSILDLLDSMKRLLADARFSPSFHHIADFRRVDIDTPQLSSADIRSLAARTVFGATSKRAFIIGPSAAFGLAKLYATQRDAGGETNMRTVATLEEAAQFTASISMQRSRPSRNWQSGWRSRLRGWLNSPALEPAWPLLSLRAWSSTIPVSCD